MHVSFSLDGRVHTVEPKDTSFKADVVDFFLGSVGATLTEIKEVELRYDNKKNIAVWCQYKRSQLLN